MARVALIVLDGVGAGAAPDAALFGDEGSNTLAHTASAVGGLHLPELERLGLGHVTAIEGVVPVPLPRASWGRLREVSPGKDTTTGHWEIAGIVLDRPLPTYPNGFPPEVMRTFERVAGVPALGNVVASGTEILDRLGEEHLRTRRPIVYTSADSVFQIAAHEHVVPIERLYEICRAMRAELRSEHAVGRVIARPFVGMPGNWQRTERRRDFSLEPPGQTMLDLLLGAGHEVVSVGKIDDVFANRGISRRRHVMANNACVDATIEALRDVRSGLVFTNLVEFDTLYGHRNDPAGMARALVEFDRRVPDILDSARPDGIVMFTADHGNDPTTTSTDHSREEVPLLVWNGSREDCGVSLGVRTSFADIGASICELFGVGPLAHGRSFVHDLPAYGERARLGT